MGLSNLSNLSCSWFLLTSLSSTDSPPSSVVLPNLQSRSMTQLQLPLRSNRRAAERDILYDPPSAQPTHVGFLDLMIDVFLISCCRRRWFPASSLRLGLWVRMVVNPRSWLYRIRPTVAHRPYVKASGADDNPFYVSDFSQKGVVTPNQLRWKATPFPSKNKKVDWLQGLRTVSGSGSPDLKA